MVVEVWATREVYSGLSTLEGVDVDPDGEREEIEPTAEIMAALMTWEGKVEES